VTPAIPCASGTAAEPPSATLSVDRQALSVGGRIVPTWASAIPKPNTPIPNVEVPAGSVVEIFIESGRCALSWHVGLADGTDLLLQLNPGLDPGYAAENQFQVPLDGFAPGVATLQVDLVFAEGATLNEWRLHLEPAASP